MAACLFDSLLLMTMAQRAALVSRLRIASVNLPFPLSVICLVQVSQGLYGSI